MKRVLTLLLLISVLAGCQVLGGGDGDDDNGNGNTSQTTNSVIRWDRDPNNIVFRAEVTGGEFANELTGLNEVPLCTVYGDNRVVWTVNSESSSLPQVLVDVLDDQDIVNFIEALTVYYRIYEFDAQADLIPSEDGVEPAVEQMTVHVNDLVHITDAFSGWDFPFFEQILTQCQLLSDTPSEFEPTQAWIRAEVIEFDTNRPSVILPENVINLAEIAESDDPTWVEGNGVRIMWAQMRSSQFDVQYEQGDFTYQVAIQVPNGTINAPPADN